GEDYIGPFSACAASRFEPDPRATTYHEDALPRERIPALHRNEGCVTHDYSNQATCATGSLLTVITTLAPRLALPFDPLIRACHLDGHCRKRNCYRLAISCADEQLR